MDDHKGYLFAVSNILKAIHDIFQDCKRKYSLVSAEKINTIKALVSSILDAVSDCGTEDAIKIANFIARDDLLVEVLVTLMNSKGSMYNCVSVLNDDLYYRELLFYKPLIIDM